MSNYKKYMITSALPYTNGPVHIGQLAGAYIPGDIYARFLRLKYGEENVCYVCGSDEHGVPITLRAQKEGVTPQDVVDKYHAIIKKSFEELGISFNIYHRTSDPLHHETASHFFKKMYEAGIFIEKENEQYFDEEKKQFLADRYIIGTCPNCANENAYGDQCEKCGTTLSPNELINPRSAISGNAPIKKKTKHWYFPLDKCEDWLRDYIVNGNLDGEQHHTAKNWKNHVVGQCKSWLDGGLHPRAMTRDLDWGVKVPIEGADGKVLYVWFDAPVGYISATRAWANEKGIDWKPFWQNKDTKLVHFIGKDNIVFHCIIFPAMLKAMADNTDEHYILPTNVPANQFMNMEGEKMSTSRNWTVWLHEYLEEFPNQQDVLRYCLIANMPENKDSDFSWKDFQERNNKELVNNIGNFVNRALVLTQKNFGGVVQNASSDPKDAELLNKIGKTYKKVSKHLEHYEFKMAMNEILSLSSAGNVYFTETEPWKLVKTDMNRVGEILNVATQLASHLAVLLQPFLPFSAEKLFDMLNLEDKKGTWFTENYTELIPNGHQINKPQHLFERIKDEVIQVQLDKLAATKKANEAAEAVTEPLKPTIEFDDFTKLDIRVGTVVSCEKMKKAKKLLLFEVDLGSEKRTIVSGIAQYFNPEELINKQVLVVANLAPRKLRGVESQGMILTAEEPDGTLKLVSPSEVAVNGSMVG